MPDLFDRLPKYVQIKEALRKEIDEGFLKEGQQLSSESALIDRFSASKMTVIRALQELVQEGYLRRVQGKGTYVTKPEQRAPLICVLIPSIDRDLYSVILHGIEKCAHEVGYEVVYCTIDKKRSNASAFVTRMMNINIAGIIVAPIEGYDDVESNSLLYEMFLQQEIPLTFLDCGLNFSEIAPVVHTNHESAMAQLTRQVIDYGHKRLLLVRMGECLSANISARIQGFQNTVNNAKESVEAVECISLSESDSFDGQVKALQEAIDRFAPSVLMSLDDCIALRVKQLLKSIPSEGGDISVTGCGDLFFAENVGLTTVRLPLMDEGEKAIKMLQAMIDGEQPISISLPSKIMVRSSLANLNEELNPLENAVV